MYVLIALIRSDYEERPESGAPTKKNNNQTGDHRGLLMRNSAVETSVRGVSVGRINTGSGRRVPPLHIYEGQTRRTRLLSKRNGYLPLIRRRDLAI